MNRKIISIGDDNKKRMKTGMDTVHQLVSSTLGPKGLNITLDRGFSVPITTNDGVSICKAIELNDEIENQGVEVIREVASKTNEQAGDGTTTSIVIAHALIEEASKYSENPMEIRRKLEAAKIKAIKSLKEISREVKGKDELLNLASISSESEEIGKIICDTIEAVGEDGVISVEEGKFPFIESKITEGYEVAKGYASPYMANNGQKAIYEDVSCFVVGDKISTITEILPFIQRACATIKELVIFCTDADTSVINTFIANKQTGMFNGLIIKVASQKNEILEDIALYTGATMVSKDTGFNLADLTMDVLGKADKIICEKDKTIITGGKGKAKTEEKIAELKEQLKTLKSDNEYDLVEKRIARLHGGVAVISVGAGTETEMRYLYYKVEDAVNAVRSAKEEGVVAGGGMTLYKVSQTLSDNDIGEKILKEALKAPLKTIINNCGKDYTDIIKNMPEGQGYDASKDEYCDMIERGIIDPTKVERCAIENSVSFAATFITSKGTIAYKVEEQK